MTSRPPIELPPLPFDTLESFLTGAAQWIERGLPAYLPRGEPAAFLYDLARDYPLRGGKRFRPALLLLCTALAGGDPARALPSAVALELFHNFALVHDDIEDGSAMRRGRPALHRAHGIALALNAGDLLFSLVHEALLDNGRVLGAEPALEVSHRFAVMFRRTFEGQAMDIGWIQTGHFPGREEFETMIRLKTGWYSGRGPCQVGALIGGGDSTLIETLGDFGETLGIGFQLRDDLLNLVADSADTAPGVLSGGYGKERGGDIAEGKRTLIVIELLERMEAPDGDTLRGILSKLPRDTTSEDVGWVIQKAESTGALDAVRLHCAGMGRQAGELARKLPCSPQRPLLEALSRYLILERGS
ncbi:MAG: polyprenyl synthetase family protein [bacterium]